MGDASAGTVVKVVRTDFVETGLDEQRRKAVALARALKSAGRAKKQIAAAKRATGRRRQAGRSQVDRAKMRARARMARELERRRKAEERQRQKALRDAQSAVRQTRREMLKSRSALAKQGRQLARVATRGLLGAGGLIAALVAVGKSAEDSELRIAGLLQKNSQLFNGSFKSFAKAHAAAKSLRKEFRELAVSSPVTAKAIEGAFTNSTTELSRAGIGIRDQVRLAKSVAIADIGNATKGTAARDVAQLLRGRSGRDITTAPLVGATGKEIAKLAKSGKVKEAARKIEEILKPSPALLKAYEDSFTGATASVKDSLTEAAEIGAKPLMRFLSKEARKLAKWMRQNRREVERIAKAIGKGIVTGLKVAGRIVKGLVDNWGLIELTVKGLATVWLVKMASNMVSLVKSARAYRAAMVAAAAANAASNLGGMGGGKGKGKGLGSKLANGAKGLGAIGTAAWLTYEVSTFVRDKIFGDQEAAKKAYSAIIAGTSNALSGGTINPEEQARIDGAFAAQAPVRGGGGGGRTRVRRMTVDQMELSERGTTRLMSPIVRQMERAARRNAPLTTQLNLGGLPVANGATR